MRTSRSKTKRELRLELERVQARVVELEATTTAIRNGDVDAIVVEGPNGGQIFTLQSAEDPYRILAERMNEGAATLSGEGTILFCNRRLAEMVMLPSEQLLGSAFSSTLREDRRNSLQGLLQSAVKNDVRTEEELLRHDGSSLPVQLSLSLVELGQGEVVYCLVATDLSELNRAKRGLREQSEIFELAQDAIVISDFESRVQAWNRGARDLYGWPAEEVLGKVSVQLLHTEFPKPLGSIMASLAAEKEWEGELRQIRRDGKAIAVASRWSLLRDESGAPIAALEINRDITARVEVEEKLRNASRYTRSLIEASLDPLVTISRAGKITDVNEATENVTGVPREQLIETDFSNYFTDPEKARQGYRQAFAEGSVRDYPLAIRSTSGVVTEVLYNASVFRNQTGEVEGVFAAARDVTERNRIEAARSQASKDLQELNRELESRVALRTQELADSMKQLESFAYSVSHDLRAPLRHIDGFLTLLSTRAYSTLDESSKHYIDRTLEGSRRMGMLIDDLLQFSRIGRAEIHKAPLDLDRVIQEVLRELEPEISKRKVHWRLMQFPRVAADRAMLLQVIENLVTNALKFTRGREAAEIEIGFKPGVNGEFVFFVRDNGVGFDMRYYNKLFQVFQRLHGEQEFEGTGIGLAIARSVVERHGGRIWAESLIGEGATFYFSLPADCNEGALSELATAHLAG
jgi:PAS domain S-box-containing protein